MINDDLNNTANNVAPSEDVNELYKPMTFTLDGVEVQGNLIDGDTVKFFDPRTNKMESLRFGFGDAAETTKITPDGLLSVGSEVGETQFNVIDNLARTEGFNNIVIEGKDKTYGRYTGYLSNAAGENFSEKLIVNNIIKPSMYLGNEVQEKQSEIVLRRNVRKDLAFLRAADAELTPYQQAEEIVQSVIQDSPVMFKQMADTSDELILGSRAYSNNLRRQLRGLDDTISDEKSTEEEVKEASEQYNKVRELLSFNMNYNNPFYGSQEQIDNAIRYKIGTPGTFAGWSNAFKRSFINLESSAATFNEWSGDLVNNDGWQQWGDDWEAEVQESYRGVNTAIDLFDIRGPGDAFKWITETAIEFAPQLAVVIGGAKAGGMAGTAIAPGPGTVVGSVLGGTAAGFALVVGQIYNSMPEGEKDPFQAGGLAAAVGVVDMLGIKGGGKLLTQNILTKEGKESFIDQILIEGITSDRDVAADLIKKSLAGILKDTGQTLQNLANKELVKRQGLESFVRAGLRGAGREGVTEGIQEIIAQGGVAALTSEELNWEELTKDVIRNAAAGGVVGSGFETISQTRSTGGLNTLTDLNALVSQYSPLKPDAKRSIISRAEENQRIRNGNVKQSSATVAMEVNAEAKMEGTTGLTLSTPSDTTSVKQGLKDFTKDPISAFRAMANATKKHLINEDGTHNNFMQKFYGLVTRDFIFTGTTISSEIDRVRADIVKNVPTVRDALKLTGAKNITELDAIIRSDVDVPGKKEIQEGLDYIKEVVAAIVEDSGAESVSLNAEQIRNLDALSQTAEINFDKIDKNFLELILNKRYTDPNDSTQTLEPLSLQEANRIYLNFKDGRFNFNDIQTIRNMNLTNDPKFKKYMATNVIGNVINTADKVIREATINKRLGEDGVNLSHLLKKAREEGEINQEQYESLLRHAKRFMQSEKGSFQRVDNPYIRLINNSLIAQATLRLMDMNAFANVAEMFYGTIGLTPKDKVKYFGKAVKIFFQGAATDYYSVPSMMGAPYQPFDARRLNDKDVNRLLESGHILPGSDVLEVEGVKTSSPTLEKTMKIFYMINLVRSQNNAPRGARMSFAWSSISKLLEKVRVDKDSLARAGGIVSPTGLWARDRLNSYGLDPDRLIEIINKIGGDTIPSESDILAGVSTLSIADSSFLQDQMGLAEINFTDEFTARPQPGSTPAIFESEVFRPFTQFKRFLAHVTANMVPRIWNTYIKSAPPGTSFDTFSSVITIMVTAYLAQALKDTIAYGGTPEWIEDEDDKFFRSSTYRAMNYTGFLGTPELMLEELNSIWKKGVNSAIDDEQNSIAAIAMEIAAVAPSLGVLQSDVKAFREGGEKGAERAVGMIPFIGSLQVTKQPLIELIESLNSKDN